MKIIPPLKFDPSHVLVQSMTNTKTHDVHATLKQIKSLAQLGCHLVRVAILDDNDIKALPDLVKQSPIPLIADIHFNYQYALQAIQAGVAKIRLNPGNINTPQEVLAIIEAAQSANIPIRIGVNGGSLPAHILKQYNNVVNAQSMLASLDEYLKIFKQQNFTNLVISLKASDPLLNLEVNQLAAKKYPYPIHCGVTEAGPLLDATIKSTIGLAPLLLARIPATIRISISDDPLLEIKVAYKILNALKIYHNRVEIISCPTCGRLNYPMFALVEQIEKYCETKFFPLKIAILGCVVNGIGEGQHADIGLAGSQHKCLLFAKGKILKVIDPKDAYSELTQLIDQYYQSYLKTSTFVNNQ